MSNKTICVATGTRAEYGLLKPLIAQIKADPSFTLQLLVTGAHLSPEFGLTYRQIEADGFTIDRKVEMLLSSDTAGGITKSMGLGMIGFGDALGDLQPDLLVVLGDRYEMLALASTALIFRIPIVHIHGGELTQGAYDDAMRHAITKMSALHFTATEAYRQRVIQLGEAPQRVCNVGAIGLDNFHNLPTLSRQALEEELGFRFRKYNYLVGFHPETLSSTPPAQQVECLLAAIDKQEESFFVFTKANADTHGREVNRLFEEFVDKNPHKARLFNSLGTVRYLSLMKLVTAVVGNSSSGIIEAPSAPTATINIGDRQKGRIAAPSVVHCRATTEEIAMAFQKVKEGEFADMVKSTVNPYGNGTAAQQIMEVLRRTSTDALQTKTFYDWQ